MNCLCCLSSKKMDSNQDQKTNQNEQNCYVQQLLTAEKKAKEIVQNSRIQRNKRLNQARLEANEELFEFEQRLETHYADFERRCLQTHELDAKIKYDNSREIREIDRRVKKNMDKIAEQILDMAFDVKPVLNPNFTKEKL